jgi:ubiquinone/menaquinone biosynthesis C-methylase UbiE
VKLNRVEKALMNNPVRATLQRTYEAGVLERLGGRVEGLRVLEIGCGCGVGTQLLLERFGAAHVLAVDLDPDMLTRAVRRLKRYVPARVTLAVADAARLPAGDESVDAVFDFGIVHHVPRWRDALAEVRRVLRPGGRFFFEEVTRQALDRWSYRTFLDHPRTDRFSPTDFVDALAQLGMELDQPPTQPVFGDFLIGVSRVPSPRPHR